MQKTLWVCILAVLLVLTLGLVACNDAELLTPDYQLPVLQATYGQTLADIPLPEGFSWVEDPSTSVGNAGTAVFHLTYTPTDTDKYKTVTDIEIVIPVNKGTTGAPSVTVLNAKYGQSLGDIALPAGFAWEDSLSTPVGEIGDQVFNVTYTPSDANYKAITGIPVTVSVGKATYDMSGVTFPNATYTYDGGMKSIAIRGTLPEGVAVRYENDTRVNAGSNTVTAVFSGDSVHYNDIPNLTATLTINKKNIVITANSAESVYGQDLAPLTATADLAMGDAEADVFTLAKAEGLNVGTYAITVTVVPNDNYNVTETVSGTYTIQKATYDMSGVFFGNGQFTYDGTAKSLAIQDALPDGVTVEYEGNEQTDADTYTVTAHFTGDAENYNLIEDKTATLTILQAEIEGLSFVDASFTYDGSSRTIEVEGMPQGASVSYALNGEAFSSAINAGSYEITATVSVSNPNYKKAELTATLVIAPKQITITGDTIRSTYGEDLLPLTATVAEGIVTGDDPASIYTLAKEEGLNAGVYDIVVTLAQNPNPNYTVYQVINGSYIIDKATYNMTGVTFEDKAVVYNGETHVLTVDGALPEGMRVLYTNNSRAQVGSTVVTASFFGDYDNYYEVESMTATLTVEKADPFLHCENENKHYTYDGQTHLFEGIITDASGELIFFPVDYKSVTPAGGRSVPIYVRENENYNSGTFYLKLYIDPAPLTVTIDSHTVTYGDPLPNFTYTVTGFVNGENENVLTPLIIPSCTYEEGDEITSSTYPITVSGITARNYAITVVEGTLTVNKIPATLTVTATNKHFDGTPAEVSTESNSIGAVTYLYKQTGASDDTYTEVAPTEAGDYTVKAVLAESAHYTAATATADFYITHKDIPRVVIETYSGTYGTPLEDPEFSILNSADMDITQSLDFTIEYKKEDEGDSAYTTEKPVNAGKYVVRVTSEANANFEGAVGTKPFIMKSKELDGNLKVTEVHAPLGVLIKDVPLPEHWSWQEPLDVRVGDEEAHYATYSGDPNYHAYPWVVIHPDAELQIYLADPDMRVRDVFLPTGWTIDETAKIAELAVVESTDSYTIVKVHAVSKEQNVLGEYEEKDFLIKLMKYQPTLTFDGSLDYELTSTDNLPPQDGSDDRLSFGETPAGTVIGAGTPILARDLTITYKEQGQDDDHFNSYVPSVPGLYVCRIAIPGTNYRNSAYVDVNYTICKITPVITLDAESVEASVLSASNQYVYATESHGFYLVYTYKSYGADGILDTEDDGEWVQSSPNTAGKYLVRVSAGGNTAINLVEKFCELTLVKGERNRMDLIYSQDTIYLGSDVSDRIYVDLYTDEDPNAIDFTYEYKPEGAADSAYTTEAPLKPGVYTVRVTASESDTYLASSGTVNCEFCIYSVFYYYYGEGKTYLFALNNEYSYTPYLCYVYDGTHSVAECKLMDYTDFCDDSYTYEMSYGKAERFVKIRLNDNAFGTFEVVDENGKLEKARLGTLRYVYTITDNSKGWESKIITYCFSEYNGSLRLFAVEGTYTQAEITEQWGSLPYSYAGSWTASFEDGIVYLPIDGEFILELAIQPDATLLPNVGEIVYLYQREIGGGPKKAPKSEWLTFFMNVFHGKNVVFIYYGQHDAESIRTASPMEGYLSWKVNERNNTIEMWEEDDDILVAEFQLLENGELLLFEGFHRDYDYYAYYYSYDEKENKNVTTTIFFWRSGKYTYTAKIYSVTSEEGFASPVTPRQYADDEYMAQLGSPVDKTFSYDAAAETITIDETSLTFYVQKDDSALLRANVDEWYAMFNCDENDPQTILLWRSGENYHYEQIPGTYDEEEYLLNSVTTEGDFRCVWEVKDGYLFLHNKADVGTMGKMIAVFALNGHTLTDATFGDCAYYHAESREGKDGTEWETTAFYRFGGKGLVFKFHLAPEALSGLKDNSVSQELCSMENGFLWRLWSEDADYVYAQDDFGMYFPLYQRTNGRALEPCEDAYSVEYVRATESETYAYILLGNKGMVFSYDEVLTKAEIEEQGRFIDLCGYWELFTDKTGVYVVETDTNGGVECYQVITENGEATLRLAVGEIVYFRNYSVYDPIVDGFVYQESQIISLLVGKYLVVSQAIFPEELTDANKDSIGAPVSLSRTFRCVYEEERDLYLFYRLDDGELETMYKINGESWSLYSGELFFCCRYDKYDAKYETTVFFHTVGDAYFTKLITTDYAITTWAEVSSNLLDAEDGRSWRYENDTHTVLRYKSGLCTVNFCDGYTVYYMMRAD